MSTENKTKLTKAQQQALSRDCNMSVTAGAGTGKTFLLVERFLDTLMNEPVDVKEILAITFTKKAAAEMKDRVLKRIEDKIKSQPEAPELKKLLYIRDRMHSASISTIHAFCARILKEYPVEAGVDPDVRQLNEMQRQLLMDDELKKEMESLDQDPARWISLFRLFGPNTIGEMLQTGLAHSFEVTPVSEWYRSRSIDSIFEYWTDTFLDHVARVIPDTLVAEINMDVNKLLMQMQDKPVTDIKVNHTIEQLDSFHRSAAAGVMALWKGLFILADYFTNSSNEAYTTLNTMGAEKYWGSENKQSLLALSQKMELVIGKKMSVPVEADKVLIGELKKFYELYDRFLLRFDNRKKELGLLDYDDLQIKTMELLLNHKTIRNKLTNKYRFIMVDEFQDTNLLQWQLINLLGEFNTNKFFIVGDPKQSIYGFRNADIRVFEQVKSEFKQSASGTGKTAQIVLGESFRFTPGLADFINRTFGKILQSSEANPWEVGYDSMSGTSGREDNGEINIAILDEQTQTDFLAYKAGVMSVRHGYGQMAVLIRNRTHLSEIEESFRRNGIPFRTIGGIGFYQRQEIYDIYYLIRFLLNPDDDNALIALLRSPFANISDEGIFILGISRKHVTYWQLLSELTDCDG